MNYDFLFTLNIWKENPLSACNILEVHLPTENVRMSNGSEFENLSSPNCSKFPVECDSDRKVSQIRTQVRYLDFFKIHKSGKFAVECVSNDIIFFKCLFSPKLRFCKKSENFENL